MGRWNCNLTRPWFGLVTVSIIGIAVACFGQANPALQESERPRLLLLFDGRVIVGDISEVAGGYSVRRAEGTTVIPFEFVSLTATSLLDAYQKQRDNLQNPNAEQHLYLARWCFRYRLRDQAVTELESALKLEPFRKEARELLQLLDAAESGPASTDGEGDADTVEAISRTAAGITPANHMEFVRHVQPLLVNKCGNATCHGSASTNGLRLHNVRTGRRHQRLHSDENLAMVLAFIDNDFPLHSPLLREPRNNESLPHRGVFAGALGTRQVELLSNWIHDVAVDRQLELENDGATVFSTPDTVIEQTGLIEEPASPSGPRIIEIPRDSNDPSSIRSRELLRNVLDEERPDAFDPEEFNRRVHGRRR